MVNEFFPNYSQSALYYPLGQTAYFSVLRVRRMYVNEVKRDRPQYDEQYFARTNNAILFFLVFFTFFLEISLQKSTDWLQREHAYILDSK